MVRRFPRRQRRPTTYKRAAAIVLGAAWAAFAAVDVAALAEAVPWIPDNFHSLLLSALPTATVTALLIGQRTSVRAAFLDGVLYERANPLAVDLPHAVGDEPTLANVVALPRGAGAHRRPMPRPRNRGD